MRYAELEGNVVRHVGGGPDYKILPPNAVEITKDADVQEGDVYEDGKFRRKTAEELYVEHRQQFDSERERLFRNTAWVRERHADLIELGKSDALWNTWLKYWQALRDMPEQLDFDPADPAWPEQPS